MKYLLVVAVAFAILAVSMAAWSKGVIKRITIQHLGTGSVLEITDPEILDRFAIWSGPGVGGWNMAKTIPAPDDAAFIINWTRGKLFGERISLSRYQVTMYVDQYQPPCNKYEVLYEVDETGAGHVYLPRWDEDFGHCNQSLISRGVEGHWFHASKAWDDLINGLGLTG